MYKKRFYADYFFLFWWSFSVFICLVHYTFIYLRITHHLMHLYHEIYGSLIVCFKKVGTLDLQKGYGAAKTGTKGFLVHDLVLLHFSQEF